MIPCLLGPGLSKAGRKVPYIGFLRGISWMKVQ
uniref:Uncharacterized protein n=1 Tax=Arundo donax TaxID=35708 RepID=A0A0A9GZ39_ARUDO